MPADATASRFVRIPITGPLDTQSAPGCLAPGSVRQLNQMGYLKPGSLAKIPGDEPYAGTGMTGASFQSGFRWYRVGQPAQTIAHVDDGLQYAVGVGNWQAAGTLAAGSTPAFFAGAYDPALSANILIAAYGSGAPMKWDGAALTQLNATITQKFTGCVSWHNHVWFWGDPANPDTLYATDLGNPESMAFCNAFGGYLIGSGDGDPIIQACVPLGDTLYVLKTDTIYAVTGFDFISGDYQFSVSQVPDCYGTIAPHSVCSFGDSIFYLATDGARSFDGYLTHRIGANVPDIMAIFAATPSSFGVAGRFQVLGNALDPVGVVEGYFIVRGPYTNVLDLGASRALGRPCWTRLVGPADNAAACLIPCDGIGDLPTLFYGGQSAGVAQMYQLAALTTGGPRAWFTTGVLDLGTPGQLKTLDCVYAVVRASTLPASLTLTVTALGDSRVLGPKALTAPAGAASGWQTLEFRVDPAIRSDGFELTLTDQLGGPVWEVSELILHVIEEAFHAP